MFLKSSEIKSNEQQRSSKVKCNYSRKPERKERRLDLPFIRICISITWCSNKYLSCSASVAERRTLRVPRERIAEHVKCSGSSVRIVSSDDVWLWGWRGERIDPRGSPSAGLSLRPGPPGFPPGSSRGLGGPERRVRGDVARPRRPGWGAREPLRLGDGVRGAVRGAPAAAHARLETRAGKLLVAFVVLKCT